MGSCHSNIGKIRVNLTERDWEMFNNLYLKDRDIYRIYAGEVICIHSLNSLLALLTTAHHYASPLPAFRKIDNDESGEISITEFLDCIG